MTKQEYVKAMTYMGVMFNKPVGKDVIEVWYEFLANVPEITFKNAIKQLALKTKFLPGLQEIMDMCSEVQSKQNNSILQSHKYNMCYIKSLPSAFVLASLDFHMSCVLLVLFLLQNPLLKE